jgi:hypothetical protein
MRIIESKTPFTAQPPAHVVRGSLDPALAGCAEVS